MSGLRAAASVLGEWISGLATLWLFGVTGLVGITLLPAALAGWQPVVVMTGSMAPAVQPGDVIVFTRDTSTIGVGSVVLVGPDQHGGLPVSHRVVQITEDGSIVTKGDANAVADLPVARDRITAVGRLRVPAVGIPLVWFRERDPAGLVWVLATLAALAVSVRPQWRDEAAPALAPDVTGDVWPALRADAVLPGVAAGGSTLDLRTQAQPVVVLDVDPASYVPQPRSPASGSTGADRSRWAALG